MTPRGFLQQLAGQINGCPEFAVVSVAAELTEQQEYFYLSSSADLKAPVLVSTTNYDWIGNRHIFSIKPTYRFSSNGRGKNSC